jgi:acyl-CoA thioesterase-1
VLVSVCGLSLAGCSATVVPVASPTPAPSPSTPAQPIPSAGAGSLAASVPGGTLRYAALGDSYTIGTSVKPRERWPNQLVRTLQPGIELDLVANLAANGATTEDVIDDQLDQLPALKADLVSLLIGVNDVVRGVDVEAYRTNLRTILQNLALRAPAARILLVTTPDYTLTRAGSDYGDPSRQSARIRAFNEVFVAEAQALQLVAVDITPVSDLVPDDATLVADDGLHPSAKQYGAWVELIAPKLRKLLHSTRP